MQAQSRARLLAALAGLGLALPAGAQAPKKFSWHEDRASLGFRIQRPEGWDEIPPNPGEEQMVMKYAPPGQIELSVGPEDLLYLYGWLVKFDRRPDAEGKPRAPRFKDVLAWINGTETGANGWSLVETYELPSVKVPAKAYLFEGPNTIGRNHPKVRCYAAVYTLARDLELAMIYNGPPEENWRKYGQAFEKMARSFELAPLDRTPAAPEVGGSSLRVKKRAELELAVASQKEWRLYETPNYFIVSNNDDPEFIEELKVRLEAIRAVYEQQYPPEVAKRALQRQLVQAGGEGEDGKDGEGAPAGGEPEDPPAGEETVATKIDPLEESRTSVVRVCANDGQYAKYGGMGGSAGYWHSGHKELVLYDDKAIRGRDFTWLVMNHEAFHQYIYYFYGSIAPHSWYNEGTGDYFSGFDYKRKKFVEGKAQGRERDIQQMIREGRCAPLSEFVRWTQMQYYGSNDFDLSGPECYAQGWSLIWFLRTGAQNKAPGWNDAWGSILGAYLDTLVATGDLDQAVDKAFAGVDWSAFEASWKAYIE